MYAIFVSPLFELADIINFADDNFVIEFDLNVNALIINMQKRLEMIVKWLKDSGLVVNEKKTELCLFHRNDAQLVSVRINDHIVMSKKTMNVLGVVFDCKLNWTEHVAHAINKSSRSLCALRLLKRYLNPAEMKMLLTSNYNSSLYYNSEIWLK